ncbi:unnamed protein product [Dovyalis caffra]|uniref:5'-3' DNA helicase ZGRF1-like N-terminal domain-containing protein n=1 Tax=Dovyalis caffra TaxID=77055 RepID=A0AAV1RVJ3_9ROSI|nr:unnamed protein product [Dovyalis caffra]
MEDIDRKKKQRWSVTYTKHIKQKRKIYQDGFLDLHFSTNKVMLFDDCDKLLECRILKDGEVVGSGETLTFNAFLVDVGDAEVRIDGDKPPPVSDLNFPGRYRKITERPTSVMRRRKFRSPSISSSDGKDSVEKNKARTACLSTSQKIIREFKKSELQRYGMPESSPDMPKSATANSHVESFRISKRHQLIWVRTDQFSAHLYMGAAVKMVIVFMCMDGLVKLLCKILTAMHDIMLDLHTKRLPFYDEWQVLYTTQMTQKTKKYHDGFLRLASCGSLGRQIMLYDASKNQLNCRFLKKDEIISSGESISFDAHLVDIGEPEGENQLLEDLNIQEKIFNDVSKPGIMHGQPNCIKDNKSVAQDKTILANKFLSLSEDVKVGSMLALPKYLVEVGEPLMSSEEKLQNNPCSTKAADSNFSMSIAEEMKLSKNPLQDGRYQNTYFLREDANSRSVSIEERTNLCNAKHKSLRDARQILSVLQKPVIQGSVAVQCVDKSINAPILSEHSELPRQSLPHEGPSQNMDVRGSIISALSGNQFPNDPEAAGISDQCHPANVEADTKCCDEASASSISSLVSSCTHGPNDDRRKTLDQLKSARKTDELPTFDLGF